MCVGARGPGSLVTSAGTATRMQSTTANGLQSMTATEPSTGASRGRLNAANWVEFVSGVSGARVRVSLCVFKADTPSCTFYSGVDVALQWIGALQSSICINFSTCMVLYCCITASRDLHM